jgi:hypothetical protein
MTSTIDSDLEPTSEPLSGDAPPRRGRVDAIVAAVVLVPGVALACAGLASLVLGAISLASGGGF